MCSSMGATQDTPPRLSSPAPRPHFLQRTSVLLLLRQKPLLEVLGPLARLRPAAAHGAPSAPRCLPPPPASDTGRAGRLSQRREDAASRGQSHAGERRRRRRGHRRLPGTRRPVLCGSPATSQARQDCSESFCPPEVIKPQSLKGRDTGLDSSDMRCDRVVSAACQRALLWEAEGLCLWASQRPWLICDAARGCLEVRQCPKARL